MVAAYDDLTPMLRAQGIITTEEAAEILGCRPRYFYTKMQRWVRPVKIGRHLFWRRADIEEFRELHPRIGTRRKVA